MTLEKPQFNHEPGRLEKLTNLYNDECRLTLYRYDNPVAEYDESREGIVSKKEIIGTWFTSNIEDLKGYIKSRSTGGTIVTVRVPKADLETFDATKLEVTKEMDIENNNYIIPVEVQAESRIEIPLKIETISPKKFVFKDWQKVDEFVNENVSTSEKILSHHSF